MTQTPPPTPPRKPAAAPGQKKRPATGATQKKKAAKKASLLPASYDRATLEAYYAKNKIMVLGVGFALVVGVIFAAQQLPRLFHRQQAPVVRQVNVHPVHDDATFEQLTKSFHITPYGDPNLEFQINLPTDWEAQKTSNGGTQMVGKKIISDVAVLRSPLIGISRATVVVQTIDLPYEIEAQYWLKDFLLKNSYIMQGDVAAQNLKRASAEYTEIQKDNTVVDVYCAVQFNGNQAMLVRFEVPLPMKDYISFLQKKSVDSFKMSFLQETPIEDQKVFTLSDALKFTYPASWVISTPDFTDPNFMNVQLLNKKPTTGKNRNSSSVDGLIRIVAVRRSASTNLQTELKSLRGFFTQTLNLNFASLVKSEDIHVGERFVFSRLETYKMMSTITNTSTQEVSLLVLGGREWYIMAFLATPSASTNLYTWARNTRTFDLLVQSLR